MNKQQALEKIEALKREISDLEKITNQSDLSKEERFLQLIDGLTIKIDKEKYSDSIFFFKGNDYYFEIEKTDIWCSYDQVWSVFKREYGMNYDGIQVFIKDMVERHFKMNGVTPFQSFFCP